ncbi:MAG: rhodanese-like domain-containing protein [Thermoleophilia bacterium]
MTDVSRDELAARLQEDGLTLIDVRTRGEFEGASGYPCDLRQGHIPGARHLAVEEILAAGGPDEIRLLVGAPEGAEVIAYCHSGSRSAMAVHALGAAGYVARNYVGSWHEWSADEVLPIESG